MGEVLTEDDLDELVIESDLAQPPQVVGGPCRAGPRPDQAPAQQQFADPVAGAHQIAAQILPGTNQITQRLRLRRRDDDRPQLPGREQPGELEGVARVGLDPVAGLTRDRPRRADHHLHSGCPAGAGQAKPGRPGLIDRADLTGQRLQPLDHIRR
jgi:hypothetical protein